MLLAFISFNISFHLKSCIITLTHQDLTVERPQIGFKTITQMLKFIYINHQNWICIWKTPKPLMPHSSTSGPMTLVVNWSILNHNTKKMDGRMDALNPMVSEPNHTNNNKMVRLNVILRDFFKELSHGLCLY